MPARDDVFLFARYPFLPGGRDYVKAQGFTLGDLLTDRLFERARQRAVARARSSLERSGLEDVATATTSDAEIELFSYPVARAIVATVGDSYLTNRYAVAESKLMSSRLAKEEPELVWRVVQHLGIPLVAPRDEAGFASLHFLPYLRNAPARDPEWKLVNQPLQRGFVSLAPHRVVRLAEEAYKDRLLEEFQTLVKPGRAVQDAFPKELNELMTLVAAHRARFAPESSGEIRLEAFPPCMRAIWGGIQKSVNIPHMGRFAIVSFLHTLGMNSEDILKFFATVPDFSVEKSRYQIEHITGRIGGSTEYSPPSCSTMQTYGICPLEERDEICLYQIHHPLSYYRRRLRMLGPKRPPASESMPTEVMRGPSAQSE